MIGVFQKSSRVNVIKCIRDIYRYGHIDLTDSSLSVCSFLVRHRDDMDLLMIHEAKNGHESIVRYLVEKGADIHVIDDRALRVASESGHESIVKYLVEKGANVHAENYYAMQQAAKNGHVSIVRYLVEKGANIHADDDLAIRWAAKYGHESVVRYLTEASKDQTQP